MFVFISTLVVGACGGEAGLPQDIAIVRIDKGQDFDATRAQAIAAFVTAHGDEFDQLVLWDTNNLLNGQFSYLPLANDVTGIGYGGDELFNRGTAEYGTERLQGAIWMGNRWRTIQVEPGPESALGILAEETMHRWGARVLYDGPDGQDHLLDELGLHWSAFLDVGSSPLGGFTWAHEGGTRYAAQPRGATELSDIDLYLMGVLPAGDVTPMSLLADVSDGVCYDDQPCADTWRNNPPAVVFATVETVTIEQVIALEGERSPAAGSAPTSFRQAWAYVVYDDDEPARADLQQLDAVRIRWEELFSEASRGLAEIHTQL